MLRFTLVSYDFSQPMLVYNSNISLKISTFGSRDFVGHVTVGPAIHGVLQVVNYNHMLILHDYGDLKTEGFWGYDLDRVGHVTSSVTWPFHSQYVVPHRKSIITIRVSCMVMEIWSLKYFGVTTLTLWGQMTSSVRSPYWSHNIWFPTSDPLKPPLISQ